MRKGLRPWEKSEMPIVALMAMHENVAGAKGHCFKRVSKEMEYWRIGASLETATVLPKRH
jgi:hypothetical protein